MESSRNSEFGWSARLRSGDIQIQGQKILRRNTGNTIRSSACLAFQLSSTEPTQWRMRTHFQQTLFVGICLEQAAIRDNFKVYMSFRDGQGYDFLASSGITLSHADTNMNLQPSGIKIQSGDIIELGYYPQQGTLRIANRNNTLKMKTDSQAGNYWAFATLWGDGDYVELLEVNK